MGDKKMETMAGNLRKLDFPATASQAITFIHSQVGTKTVNIAF